jgi:hypothetical protein
MNKSKVYEILKMSISLILGKIKEYFLGYLGSNTKDKNAFVFI